MADASLILPCYNEAEHFTDSIEKIIRVIQSTYLEWEIIFIDDKSKDNTRELIKSCVQKKYSGLSLRYIFHQRNLGRGSTVAEGVMQAKGELVGFIDIDCEVPPYYIPLFIDKLKEGYDVVYAWRIYQFSFYSIPRYIASQAYIFLQHFLLNTNFPDSEAGFKFFDRQKILPVLKKVKAKHWFWDTEILVKAQKEGLMLGYIPTVFIRRNDKTSTVRLLPDTIKYLKELLRLKKELHL